MYSTNSRILTKIPFCVHIVFAFFRHFLSLLVSVRKVGRLGLEKAVARVQATTR